MAEPYVPSAGAIITTADQWREGDKWRLHGDAEWYGTGPPRVLNQAFLIELVPAPREVTITLTEDDARKLERAWGPEFGWVHMGSLGADRTERFDAGERIAQAIRAGLAAAREDATDE